MKVYNCWMAFELWGTIFIVQLRPNRQDIPQGQTCFLKHILICAVRHGDITRPTIDTQCCYVISV